MRLPATSPRRPRPRTKRKARSLQPERSGPVAVWWTLWLTMSIGSQFLRKVSTGAETWEELTRSNWLNFAHGGVSIAAAVAVFLVVRGLHEDQQRHATAWILSLRVQPRCVGSEVQGQQMHSTIPARIGAEVHPAVLRVVPAGRSVLGSDPQLRPAQPRIAEEAHHVAVERVAVTHAAVLGRQVEQVDVAGVGLVGMLA